MAEQFLKKIEPLHTTHGGREKLMRFLQYFLGFLNPTLSNMYPASDSIKQLVLKMTILRTNMSLTRKIFRFGSIITIL
jgi:hypothetical protein